MAAAIAVRVAYVLEVAERIPMIGDAATYRLLAIQLADGRGYIRPDRFAAGVVEATAEFPPLFPAVLAVAAEAGVSSPQGLRLVAAGIGGVTVVLTGLLARRITGKDVAGLVGALLATVHLTLIESEAALGAESLHTPLVLGAALLACRAADEGGWRRWAVSGGVLGLATLTRTESPLLLLVLFAPLAVRARPRQWVGLAAATAATIAVVLPWTVRNAVRLDAFVPVSTNAGGLVLGANCPPTYDERVGLWLFACYSRVDQEGLREADRARAFLDEGLDYASDHAGRLATVVAPVRVGRTWGVYAPNEQVDFETLEGRDRQWHRFALRQHLGILILAGAGAIRVRRSGRPVLVLLSFAALVTIMSLVTYGNQRFRLPADPVLVAFASAAIVGAKEVHRD